jgi:hypothetical protein
MLDFGEITVEFPTNLVLPSTFGVMPYSGLTVIDGRV